jgi:hypothetical protein
MRARDNITKFSRELNKLKIRSRITEAVKVEAGSDDREICKQFLRDTNTKVIQRRCELEAEISRLEEVRRTSREVCDIIDDQAMRLMTELNASNPDVDFFITYWQ